MFGARDKFIINLFAKLQKKLPVMLLAGADARFQPVWVEDVASAVVHCLEQGEALSHNPRVIEACGPDVFTLKELVQLSAQLSGVREGEAARSLRCRAGSGACRPGCWSGFLVGR